MGWNWGPERPNKCISQHASLDRTEDPALESVWRLPTPVGSQRALSYIIEMLSHEALHSRTVFNLRDGLMAFWDSLFPPWFSREAGGSFASSLKKKEGKKKERKRERKKKVFLLQECSESPLLQLASMLVKGEMKKWRKREPGLCG